MIQEWFESNPDLNKVRQKIEAALNTEWNQVVLERLIAATEFHAVQPPMVRRGCRCASRGFRLDREVLCAASSSGSNSNAAWVDEAGMAPRDVDRKRSRAGHRRARPPPPARMGIEAIYRKPNTSKPRRGTRSTPI
jgi:hypothetical protein